MLAGSRRHRHALPGRRRCSIRSPWRENVGYRLMGAQGAGTSEAHRRVEEVLGFVGLGRIHRPQTVRAVGRAAPPCRDRARDCGQAAASCSSTIRPSGLDPITPRPSTTRSSSCAISEPSPRLSSPISCRMRFMWPRTGAGGPERRSRLVEVDAQKADEAEFIMLRNGRIAFEGNASELRQAQQHDPYIQSFLS